MVLEEPSAPSRSFRIESSKNGNMVSPTLQNKLKSKDERKAKEKVEGKRVMESLVELPNKKSKNKTQKAPPS